MYICRKEKARVDLVDIFSTTHTRVANKIALFQTYKQKYSFSK